MRARLESDLRGRIDRLRLHGDDWDLVSPDCSSDEIRTGIILKEPRSSGEKGVLFISFEAQWLRLFRFGDIRKLASNYHLVLAPSWSPPHDVALQLAARLWPGRLFSLLSNFDDVETMRRLAPNLEPVRLLASSWVNPGIFDVTEPVHKEYEIVVLANFAAYKRHFLLFRALSEMPPATRALLLGRAIDRRTANTLLSEADLYGVRDQITIKEGLPDGHLVRAMRSARVSLMFTGTEGSCVAVVESLFAGVPVGLFANARIGSKVFINEETGALLQPHAVGRQLQEFIGRADRLTPRRWALEHGISCFGSTKVLNEAIKAAVVADGEPWTQDIAVHHWRPNPSYVHDDDVMRHAPAYRDFARNYGCRLLLHDVNGAAIRER